MDARAIALEVLALESPAEKAAAARELHRALDPDALDGRIDAGRSLSATRPLPGRPSRPRLVAPKAVRSRSVHTIE